LTTASQPNITSLGVLTSLNVSGIITGTMNTANQPNITSLGTLTGLNMAGDLDLNENDIIEGNIINAKTFQTLDVNGSQWRILFGSGNLNFMKQNVNSTWPSTPSIFFSNNNTINTSNTVTQTLRVSSNAVLNSALICSDLLGNTTWTSIVNSLSGTNSQVLVSANTGNITLSLPQNIHSAATPTFAGLTINGNIAGTLATASQPHITSVGTLTGLTVSGGITGTLVTASQPNITSVGTLTGLTVSGGITGTLATASQPNITSLGTLTGLTVNGNIAGTLTTGSQPHITSVGTLTGLNVSGNIAGTLTTASQPHITSLGTLTDLTVSGNIGGTLTTVSQPNITSVGTLTGLNVSGNISVGNSLYIHNSQYTQTDLDKITNITNGTASSNKALVVDNQRRIGNIDRTTTNELSVANIITSVDFHNNEINYPSRLNINNGSLTNTALNFYSHNCGIYSASNRHINFVSNNIDRFEINDSITTSKQPLYSQQFYLNSNGRSRIFEVETQYYYDTDNILLFRCINPSNGSVNHIPMTINTNGEVDINTLKTSRILPISGSQIVFNPSNPVLNMGASGFAPPSYTTQSIGQKLILWNQLDSVNANYSVGINAGEIYLNSSNRSTIVGFFNGDTRDAYISQNGLHVNGIQAISGDIEVKTNINVNGNNISNVGTLAVNNFIFGNGSATTPSISFITNEGFYRPSKDNIGLTLNGVQRVNFSTTLLDTSLNILAPTLGLTGSLTVGGLTTLNGNAITNGTHIFNNTITANSTVSMASTINCQSTSTLNINGTLSSSTTATLAFNNLLTLNNTTTAGNLRLKNTHATGNLNLRLLYGETASLTQTPYLQLARTNAVSDLEIGVAGFNGSLISDSLQGDTVVRNHSGRIVFGCGNRNVGEVRINNSNIGIPLWVDTGFGVNVNNFGYLNNGGVVGYYVGVPQNWAVSLYTGQAIVCNAQIMVISDKRTKHDIVDIDEKVIEDFLKIDTKEFKKDGQTKPQFGYMAQDLAKVSPNFVNLFARDGVLEEKDSDGFVSPANALFSVNYECIDAIQHMILKSQQAKIKELKSKLDLVETKLVMTETQLNNIVEILSRNNIK
jgi:hypothetical protein